MAIFSKEDKRKATLHVMLMNGDGFNIDFIGTTDDDIKVKAETFLALVYQKGFVLDKLNDKYHFVFQIRNVRITYSNI